MEKTATLKKIALLQRSAASYEQAILQQKDKIRRLRAAGDRSGEAESALGHLQAYRDAILRAISAHLDILDSQQGDHLGNVATRGTRSRTGPEGPRNPMVNFEPKI